MRGIGNKGLKSLSNQKLFGKDLIESLNFCVTCLLGQSHRVCFEIGSHTTKRLLNYVHADLWKPKSHAHFDENKYFLSIVGDYSRKV